MNKWQTMTDMEVNQGKRGIGNNIKRRTEQRWFSAYVESLAMLSEYCSEFLIHAADVEGLCKGIDQELVQS